MIVCTGKYCHAWQELRAKHCCILPPTPPQHLSINMLKTYIYMIVCTGRWCEYCHAWQELRAKHCHVCSRCVRRFDHHCAWTNNCVGEANHARYAMPRLVAACSKCAGPVYVYKVCSSHKATVQGMWCLSLLQHAIIGQGL